MTKEQFFSELKQSLEGEVSAYEVSDSLSYYRQYFEEEMGKGKSEQEIIASLGSPRLIARSIIDARGIEDKGENGENAYDNYGKTTDDSTQEEKGFGTLQSIGKRVVEVAITILVLFLIFSLVRALLPLALMIVAILLILKLIRR
ncbi:MAG: DUF1700 domain-containing protein [Lachnospiraceae bacterium]|nr:DUF1700 domain-containing protein [Lachnospiraceae bacterium]MDY5498048.1 DUF1700 domain-containing protein [Anaerobutyricum sp.]